MSCLSAFSRDHEKIVILFNSMLQFEQFGQGSVTLSQSAKKCRDDNRAKRRRRDAFGNFAESSHRRRGNLRTSCVLVGRNFFPQHSGGYKLRARQAAARNFRPLTRFQMFSEFAGGKFETLPGRLSRVTFNQICTIPGVRTKS